MTSATVALPVAVWAGGAFSGLVAAASRYRYKVLLVAIETEVKDCND